MKSLEKNECSRGNERTKQNGSESKVLCHLSNLKMMKSFQECNCLRVVSFWGYMTDLKDTVLETYPFVSQNIHVERTDSNLLYTIFFASQFSTIRLFTDRVSLK